jgi:hypothetical protein
MKHYIYTLSNPNNGEIFYVGCTSDAQHRACNHKYECSKSRFECGNTTPKDVYILQMQADPIFHVIEEVDGFKEVALIRESFWITFLVAEGFPLTNQRGGDLEIILKSELYGLPKYFNPIKIRVPESEALKNIQAA